MEQMARAFGSCNYQIVAPTKLGLERKRKKCRRVLSHDILHLLDDETENTMQIVLTGYTTHLIHNSIFGWSLLTHIKLLKFWKKKL